ncbi:hypothetical protein PF005_g31126 [Phytophthora fragariae]|uniref:RxLR effector protein n=1 Tax=Phytophthora fragariae TaxID=53985 RepID=A0A6A3GS92_9STRA|nr:hypothetical protein PF003_g18566 [Phytophthora fragariae]KAE8918406.1 hypothetical protein PF009_g31279 [Phytophthora fragariae]KAE8959598.1 hypothetical protein PF011_g30372 [Phytophthora fragariae]KAE9059014.1 hypothetical protein PF010_g30789 [Phytophthora fragariae]KAE9059984.1 hypothetical protein PF007_g30767 [Phytophthora fragariae]
MLRALAVLPTGVGPWLTCLAVLYPNASVEQPDDGRTKKQQKVSHPSSLYSTLSRRTCTGPRGPSQ